MRVSASVKKICRNCKIDRHRIVPAQRTAPAQTHASAAPAAAKTQGDARVAGLGPGAGPAGLDAGAGLHAHARLRVVTHRAHARQRGLRQRLDLRRRGLAGHRGLRIDPQQGTAYLLDAARRADDETVYQRATDMAIQSRAGPAALEAVRAWRQAFPQSLQATRYELQVLLALGRVSETAKPVKTLLDALPAAEKVSFIAALPALYQRVASKDEALQAVETALADALKDPALAPAAWTTVGRLRLQQGDRTGALVAATLGLDAGPESQWPALLALQLFSGTGENQAEPLIDR